MNRRARIASTAVVLIAAAWSTLAPVPVVFNVVARTERLNGELAMPLGARWAVAGACVSDGCSDLCSPGLESFDGRVELDPGVSLLIERVGSGPLLVHAERLDEQRAGRLYHGETLVRELAGCAIFRFDDLARRQEEGRVVVLPFTAELELGEEVGVPVVPRIPLLLSGKVSVLRRTLIGDAFYDTGSVELDTGDRFVVTDSREPARGFVRVDESQAMTAVFRAQGRGGRVFRFGAGSFSVGATLAERVTNDPVILGLWASGGFLLGLLAVRREKKLPKEGP
jgi:hypothetical protein